MISEKISLATFQQIPAFHNFNESECHQMSEVAYEKSFAPGKHVLEQGKTSQNLWIVLSGKCEVVKDSLHDGPVVLAELEPYSLFGELSFFSPAPHSASVIAKTPLKLLCITRVDYDDLIRDGVAAAYKLAYNVVGDVASRLRRMDDWIAELSGRGEHHDETKPEKQPEWRAFREKLFTGWNL